MPSRSTQLDFVTALIFSQVDSFAGAHESALSCAVTSSLLFSLVARQVDKVYSMRLLEGIRKKKEKEKFLQMIKRIHF